MGIPSPASDLQKVTLLSGGEFKAEERPSVSAWWGWGAGFTKPAVSAGFLDGRINTAFEWIRFPNPFPRKSAKLLCTGSDLKCYSLFYIMKAGVASWGHV